MKKEEQMEVRGRVRGEANRSLILRILKKEVLFVKIT